MTAATHVYRDSGLDAELDHKTYKVAEKLSESINTIANEPSLAFYRIQEHVRKTLPQLVEQKHEVEEVQQLVQGACFDTEYAGNAVKGMQKSVIHFQNIQELLKNAMFMKQQIDYEEARKKQSRGLAAGNGKEEGPGENKEGDATSDMADSALSTDSSLAASAHANTERHDQAESGSTEESAGVERKGMEGPESTTAESTTSRVEGPESTTSPQEGPELTASSQEGPELTPSSQEGPEKTLSSLEDPELTPSSQEGPELTPSSQEGPELTPSSQEGPEKTPSSQEGTDFTSSTQKGMNNQELTPSPQDIQHPENQMVGTKN